MRRSLKIHSELLRRGRELLDEDALSETIDRLVADSQISRQQTEILRHGLALTMERSAYVTRHLGAHLAIAAVFAFDAIPLPLGTVSRVGWVLGSRAYETAFGRRDRARVHSFGVLALAAIPLLGYGAYLIPLRRVSPEAGFLYANRISYALTNGCLESLVAGKARPMRQLARWLAPPLMQESELAARNHHPAAETNVSFP